MNRYRRIEDGCGLSGPMMTHDGNYSLVNLLSE
jgi:hypothetical protein